MFKRTLDTVFNYRSAKQSAERAQLNFFQVGQVANYIRSQSSEEQQTTTPFSESSAVTDLPWLANSIHPLTFTPSKPTNDTFACPPSYCPSSSPSTRSWALTGPQNQPPVRPFDESGEENQWENCYPPAQAVYVFENGAFMTNEELTRAGLGPWMRALTWFGQQLLELAMGDHSTIAGLAPLVLLNYQTLSGEPALLFTITHKTHTNALH